MLSLSHHTFRKHAAGPLTAIFMTRWAAQDQVDGASVSEDVVIETDSNLHQPSVVRIGRASRERPDTGGLAIGRVTKGVATALGKTIAVDRDGALPDCLASLVERLQAGPLGQSQLKPRRVA